MFLEFVEESEEPLKNITGRLIKKITKRKLKNGSIKKIIKYYKVRNDEDDYDDENTEGRQGVPVRRRVRCGKCARCKVLVDWGKCVFCQ